MILPKDIENLIIQFDPYYRLKFDIVLRELIIKTRLVGLFYIAFAIQSKHFSFMSIENYSAFPAYDFSDYELDNSGADGLRYIRMLEEIEFQKVCKTRVRERTIN